MESKQEIRQRIWKVLEEKNIASFPRPVYGRIPNFIGAEKAAENLARTPEFRNALFIKVNPDSPQRRVRELALEMGKIVLVPTPRLKGEFFLLDPRKIRDYRFASTIQGFTKLGQRVDIYNIDKIDMIVAGSVAVTLTGERIGKGEGYSELEYAMLRELGKVSERTPIVTTVHEVQIVDEIPYEVYDLTVDIIATPQRVIYTHSTRPKPKGLYIEYLTKEKINDTPFLKQFLIRFHGYKE